MASRIQGRVRLRKVLKILPETVRARIKGVVMEGAEDMAGMARRLAPVHTGDLREKIEVSSGADRPDLYNWWKSRKIEKDPELAAIVHSDSAHSRDIEFGTSPHVNAGQFAGSYNPGVRAQPFFFPAYRATRKKAQAKINRAARQGIKDGLR